MSDAQQARSVLESYRVPGKSLYIVGSFDTGVTVLSQQTRALNLVWALVEASQIPIASSENSSSKQLSVAIVGGGFSGLTVAAGLLKKQVNAQITIFEERDTLLPLQQGCDSRWLHPQIYNWPGEGSEAFAAMLPVLNWTAARASDVVVQVLTEWKGLLTEHRDSPTPCPKLYCNARHLQIFDCPNDETKLRIEWVGEERNPTDATLTAQAVGSSADFDIVIMTVGFGLEADADTLSYWRNEMIGQPSLDHSRRMYMVSGQGDGAMIDLLRLRISQYRQDRILEELFDGKDALLEAVKHIYEKYKADPTGTDLFEQFEALVANPRWDGELTEIRRQFVQRLRRDTDAILRVKVRRFADLFNPANAKTSFQNKLLVYLLYKCGGFVPSCLDEEVLAQQHSIWPNQIIRRHGTYRDEHLKQILSNQLYERIFQHREGKIPDPFAQTNNLLWSGGYFDFPGRLEEVSTLGNPVRQRWRKEYLPTPTALMATTFCAALAGRLKSFHSPNARLRVTLHRTLRIGIDPLLQQACDYEGILDREGANSTLARTFPALNATIGLAYSSRRIVRSLRGVTPEVLRAAMEKLNLHQASRDMSRDVTFILAVPILQPEAGQQFFDPSPVTGVIYIDSEESGFYIDDQELGEIVSIIRNFVQGTERLLGGRSQRLRNVPLTGLGGVVRAPAQLPETVVDALELVEDIDPPRTTGPFQFNLDYSDFIPYRRD